MSEIQMSVREIGERWHRFNTASEPMPERDAVPLADNYIFVGPPMTFSDPQVYVDMNRAGGIAWVTGGGPTEVLAHYSDDKEWFTSVFSFHPATSDQRIIAVTTSRIVDGEVVEDYLAYDPRVAYNQVTGLQERLAQNLSALPATTYGLP